MQIVCPLSIDAPAHLVFCWITHRDRIAQWMPNLVDSEIQRDTEGRVGTTLRQVYQGKRRRFEIPVKVTAYELNRRLCVWNNFGIPRPSRLYPWTALFVGAPVVSM